MNVFNKFLLKMMMLPSGLYQKMGVDIRQLTAILNAKLTIDDRRPNSFQQMRQKQNKKQVSRATISTMLMALLAGGVFAFFAAMMDNLITKFTIYFSFYITFLASILIADFTSVLIDVRDNYIILPKPVNDSTFVLSRLLHIFIHVCKIVIPMALPGAIFFTVQFGALALITFLPIILMVVLFTIFLINACYILILKVTTPQRFQNIISYIQIVFAIFFYACYQILPRIINRFGGFDISTKRWVVFIPSYWFAGGWQQLFSPINSLQFWLCLALTFIVPLFSIWVVIKYFAPSFNQKLALIGSGTIEGTASGKTKGKGASAYSRFLSKLFTKKGAEQAGFLFTWKMILRSRDFKMKVYPAMGYMLVIIVMIFFGMKGMTMHDISTQDGKGKYAIIISIYFSNLLLISALGNLTISDKFKAAWIFFISPVESPGKIISGAVKAAIAQFFFPLVIITLLLLVSIAGPSVIPNALFGFCNQLLVAGLSAYFSTNKLPFSSPQNIKRSSGGMLRMVFTIAIGGILGTMHYMLYNITPVIIILTVLSAIAVWMIFDSIRKLSWKKMQAGYED